MTLPSRSPPTFARPPADMRVAHVLRKYVPREWGGTETALKGLASGLAEHGAQSIVFCPEHPSSGGRDPLAESGCDVRRFRACVPYWGLSESVERQMLAVGGNLLSFDLPRDLAREPDLSVIHTHTLGRLGGIAGTIARRRRIPFVVSIHGGALDLPAAVTQRFRATSRRGVEWGRLFGWWWRARHVLAEADAILTCNTKEAALLKAQYPDVRVIVQPHGVDTALYSRDRRAEAMAAYPSIAGRDLLIVVARIDPAKNQLWVVQRLASLRARHPRAMLALVGACTHEEYGAELQREIERLGLARHVLLTGGLPPGHPHVVGLMQSSRVVILPSIAETFGLVIVEAWSARRPIIASRTSGPVELIRDGENGLLFDVDNPAGFETLVDGLLTDAGRARSLVEHGAESAKQFDTTALAGRVRRLYSDLAELKHALRHSA